MPVDLSSYNQPDQPNALGVAQNALGVANQAQQLKTGQFDLINKQYGQMNGILSTLASDPDLTTEKYMGKLSYLAQMGMITPQMAATESSQVYQTGGDKAKLTALANNHVQQGIAGQGLFNAMYGTQTLNTGNALQTQRVNQIAGQVTPMAGGTTTTTMSPGDSTSMVTLKGPDGREYQMTKAQAARFVGGAVPSNGLGASYSPPLTPPGGNVAMPSNNLTGGQPSASAPNALGVSSPTPAPITPSSQPVSPMRPQAPAATAPDAIAAAMPPAPRPAAPVAAATTAQSGAIPGVAGPIPGTNEAATHTLTAGADQGAQLQAQAGQAPQRKATLSTMESLLPKITTGPNAEKINTLKSGANVLSNVVGGPALFDPKTIAAQAEFDKSAALLQAQQSASLGNTDAGKMIAAHANPNSGTSNEGNLANIQILKGNEDAIAAKNSAWQAYKQANGQGSDYGAFENSFNKTYSPRAYQFPYMSPAERTELFKSMSPAERQQVQGAIEYAEKNGYIKAPGK